MRKNLTVLDAQLRLEQLKEGQLPSENTRTLESALYARAYDGFLRCGTLCNTLREGTDEAGGYLVPDMLEKRIVDALAEKNVVRRLATVMTTRGTLKIPVSIGDGHAYWVPEEGAIPESSTSFDQLQLGAHKLATMLRVSDELLEDSAFSMEDYIAQAFAERLADAEEEAFLKGDGKGKPFGLVHQLEQVIATEKVGGISIDDLIDLQHAVPRPYREKAVFLMNDLTVRELYKTRSAYGRNIWEMDIRKDVPHKLLGAPVIICEKMPVAAAGNMAALYGDFSRYVIGDRDHRSVKRLNEVYAQQGQVGFLISQRVDAVLMDKRAMAGLKVS